MFLTHCVIVLTVLIQPVWSAANVIQPYRVDSTNGTARVQCLIQDDTPSYPYSDPEELRVILLKGLHGNQELCSSILNITEKKEVDTKTKGHVQCTPEVKEGAVEVMVSGLKPTDTDIYRCEIQIFYPPPFLRLTGNGTLIHVLGSSDCSLAERQITHQNDDDDDDDGDGERKVPVSLPVAVLMTLVILVLIVIIYLQTVQCLRGRRETIRQAAIANMFHKVDTAGFSY
ncbi:cytotoxic T-lymphocyte protein 4 [Sphaeramia orbicularis]|uniref:Cytotoxic T-lymphocyte protein 4-like n=1 Tax=Sphaeramia orbicularis TaxID=375764 RepID=A0A673B350_9TELE|nr:cytotoxic T-lymphocyte protein 4-like [Sphaeramia orbicularis]